MKLEINLSRTNLKQLRKFASSCNHRLLLSILNFRIVAFAFHTYSLHYFNLAKALLFPMDDERLLIHRELQFLRACGTRDRKYIEERYKKLEQAERIKKKNHQKVISTRYE